MSDLNSSICEKNNIILRNPDGTIIHCAKEELSPSVIHNKACSIEDINLSDDDLRHIIDISTETDYPFLIKQIISLFKNYINVYIIIKSCEVFLSYYLLAELYLTKDLSIAKINNLFQCGYSNSYTVLIWSLSLFGVFTMIYAVMSIIMIKIKNIKLMKTSSYFTLFFAIIDIPLSFFHL